MKKIIALWLGLVIMPYCAQARDFNYHEVTPAVVDAFLSQAEMIPDVLLRAPSNKVKWKLLVFMEADNNLYPYALKDLQEMMRIGSNDNLTILVQLDGLGERAFTKRLLVQKNKIAEIGSFKVKLDGGSAQTLIDFYSWADSQFPSDHTMLVLWNHGSGVLDPSRGRPFNAQSLFHFNPETNMFEIDRSMNFSDYLKERGICFSDTFNSYLTNQSLEYALAKITQQTGKKIDILGFDACLMSMIEIAEYARLYANYMVSSQEVEPGTGWYYDIFLAPLAQRPMQPVEVARQAVESYRQGYVKNTPDYTQSALDLKNVHNLISCLHATSNLLLQALQVQSSKTVEKTLLRALDTKYCTRFAETSYADLGHFLKNLLSVVSSMKVSPAGQSIIAALKGAIQDTLNALNKVIVSNSSGYNLKNASGLSIYFPLDYMASSYQSTNFYKNTGWGALLNYFYL